MSVAFRRDSDEEHLEPKFELPIPLGPNLVTPRGLLMITQKVESLEADIAVCPDDTQRTTMKRELRYWRTRQATAQVAAQPSADIVAFGLRVTIQLNNAVRTIDIVGGDEAEPAAARIAFSSPLARAIMGASVGDQCDFGGMEEAIGILAIDVIPEN